MVFLLHATHHQKGYPPQKPVLPCDSGFFFPGFSFRMHKFAAILFILPTKG